ncbi:putative acetyltransferase [Larkinella arboricola]|uniref:Putative acetyltransferase n=1 Tax=Larkinella arboricola TaxID=643671 RepID=A0A327WWX4_LARAB|nr:GNAT family N-acetyltransferase [Larkinella arboricola]RAJ97812.1 putative acetyltransferase [Larkinella arboricola]
MQLPIVPLQPTDYPEVVDVWEASVRPTHHFLTEADIQYYKPLILNEYLKAVNLVGIRDEAGKLTAFLGTADHKIEMLFIHPQAMGQGLGKRLIHYAINQVEATKVDVNEDNPQAVGFYKHLGFQVVSRSEVDAAGKPFPILHMERVR